MIKTRRTQSGLSLLEKKSGQSSRRAKHDIESFKFKKSFGSSTSLELLLDQDTKVSSVVSQIKVQDQSFSVSEILRGGTKNNQFIKLKAAGFL